MKTAENCLILFYIKDILENEINHLKLWQLCILHMNKIKLYNYGILKMYIERLKIAEQVHTGRYIVWILLK